MLTTLPVAKVDIVGGVTTEKLRRGIEKMCVAPPEAESEPLESVRVALPGEETVRATESEIIRPRKVRSIEMSEEAKFDASTRTTSEATVELRLVPVAKPVNSLTPFVVL